MKREIALGKDVYTVTAHRHGADYAMVVDENVTLSTRLEHIEGNNYKVMINGVSTPLELVVHGEQTFIHAFGQNFELDVMDPIDRAAAQGDSSSVIKAPMPGMIVEINVEPGQKVVHGEPLLSIESMKLMIIMTAWRDGEIKAINFAEGDTFEKNAILATMIEEESTTHAPI
jgi:3-methylcrotonyl-CoA carboxylase alpha subunit